MGELLKMEEVIGEIGARRNLAIFVDVVHVDECINPTLPDGFIGAAQHVWESIVVSSPKVLASYAAVGGGFMIDFSGSALVPLRAESHFGKKS
jgi:hypothetical protein